MTVPPEPWRTAQLYLNECGDQAEHEMRRLAQELMSEGNAEDATKLFEAYQALKLLRQAVRPGSAPLN